MLAIYLKDKHKIILNPICFEQGKREFDAFDFTKKTIVTIDKSHFIYIKRADLEVEEVDCGTSENAVITIAKILFAINAVEKVI